MPAIRCGNIGSFGAGAARTARSTRPPSSFHASSAAVGVELRPCARSSRYCSAQCAPRSRCWHARRRRASSSAPRAAVSAAESTLPAASTTPATSRPSPQSRAELDAAFALAVRETRARYLKARAVILQQPAARAYLGERLARAADERERFVASALIGWLDERKAFEKARASLTEPSRRKSNNALGYMETNAFGELIAEEAGPAAALPLLEIWVKTFEYEPTRPRPLRCSGRPPLARAWARRARSARARSSRSARTSSSQRKSSASCRGEDHCGSLPVAIRGASRTARFKQPAGGRTLDIDQQLVSTWSWPRALFSAPAKTARPKRERRQRRFGNATKSGPPKTSARSPRFLRAADLLRAHRNRDRSDRPRRRLANNPRAQRPRSR